MKNHRVCQFLRNKSMYIPALEESSSAENVSQTGHSHHCWCNCTLTEVGPDDRPVGNEVCNTTRTCFEE